MKNSRATLKMIRRCRLENLIARQENRNRQRSRIYQLRQEMDGKAKGLDSSLLDEVNKGI